MKRMNIFAGDTIVLKNGCKFVIRMFKGEQALFSINGYISNLALRDICDENLNPINALPIVQVFNSKNELIWERFTCSDIDYGHIIIDEHKNEFMVINYNDNKYVLNKNTYKISKINLLSSENILYLNNIPIIVIKNQEGKIVYTNSKLFK